MAVLLNSCRIRGEEVVDIQNTLRDSFRPFIIEELTNRVIQHLYGMVLQVANNCWPICHAVMSPNLNERVVEIMVMPDKTVMIFVE